MYEVKNEIILTLSQDADGTLNAVCDNQGNDFETVKLLLEFAVSDCKRLLRDEDQCPYKKAMPRDRSNTSYIKEGRETKRDEQERSD